MDVDASGPVALTRSWCLLEIHLSFLELPTGRVSVLLSPAQQRGFFESLSITSSEKALQQLALVDLADGETRNPADMDSIREAVRAGGGVEQRNKAVKALLRNGLVSALRAIVEREERRAPANPQTLIAITWLGTFLATWGDLAGAAEQHRRALRWVS
eukprot:gene7170-2057_t